MAWTAGGLAGSKNKDADIWCGNAGAPAPPNCLPTVPTGGGNQIRACVIGRAWSTGCLNTDTNKFIFPRLGGHADWPGNQVISLDVTASPDFWSLDKNYSTAYAAIPGSGPWPYKYGTNDPASVHSYGAVCYMPSVQRVWSGGGIFWSPAGDSVPQAAFWWNPSGLTWTEKATRPGGYGCVTGWDSVGARMILRVSSSVFAYDPTLENGGPAGSAYTKLFDQSGSVVASSTLAIDGPNRKCYRIDGSGKALKLIDFNNLGAKEVSLTCTGDTQILSATAPGLLYRDNRLVGLGPSATANKFAVYTAVVEGHGRAGEPPVAWVRDAADANEPGYVVTPLNGVWNNFFGPIGGKYYFQNNMTDDQTVQEYTPSWSSAATHTVYEVSGHSIEVLP